MNPIVRAQGWYYLVGGVWPLVHMRSFEAVAGPKPDRFQTDVTSGLFAAIGATLVVAPARARVGSLLAATSAVATLLTDVRHLRDLRRVFVAEAVLEAAFLVAAASDLRRGGAGRGAARRPSRRVRARTGP